MMEARKILGGSTIVLAILIVIATGAYACVPFWGNLQQTGGTASSPLVSGDGKTTTHTTYCGNVNPTSAGAATEGNFITVTVSETQPNCAGSTKDRLTNNSNHTVIINNATTVTQSPFSWDGSDWNHVDGRGCFFSTPPAGNLTLDTAFSVSAGGAGSKSYSLSVTNNTDSSTTWASSLCVGKGGGVSQGIFVPIKITAV